MKPENKLAIQAIILGIMGFILSGMEGVPWFVWIPYLTAASVYMTVVVWYEMKAEREEED